MSDRDIALALVWAGAIILAVLLVQRMRNGAWDEDAFDNPPPVKPWNWLAIGAALVLFSAGTVLLVRALV
jgi:phosphoglycerol transferase MdoB-like AlkP superfamily enzyme